MIPLLAEPRNDHGEYILLFPNTREDTIFFYLPPHQQHRVSREGI